MLAAVVRRCRCGSARKTPLHPERYYPHARIRVFHHSGPEIPGSAREGKPRSFFLCFLKIFKKVVAFGVTRAADPRAWTGLVRRGVDRLFPSKIVATLNCRKTTPVRRQRGNGFCSRAKAKCSRANRFSWRAKAKCSRANRFS